MKIQQALISVSDKQGVVEFARGLADLGIKILSTGGTAKLLREARLAVTEVADYTGFPEMLDGRVKTLHPKVHGGILAMRDNPQHIDMLKKHDIPLIDLVCVNLYPFLETIAKPDVTFAKAIENIDIGGPAMVRSSAKNHAGVAIVTDPADYAPILSEMREKSGALTQATRFELAKKAFTHTARYDAMIANWLTAQGKGVEETPDKILPAPITFPEHFQLAFDRAEILRYGENPHQEAAFYREQNPTPGSIASYRQLQGKALSYNNIADSDAAWECVKSFDKPACVIVKHANPCGVAFGKNLREAYEKAFRTDPASAFGGILAFNGEVGEDIVEAMNGRKHFVEVLIAPSFTKAAKALFETKQNLRVLEVPWPFSQTAQKGALDFKRIGGGILAQTPDDFSVQPENLKVVSQRAPTPTQIEDMLFAFKVAKFVKSNAIVFCKDGMTLGVGAGQMSRVDSTRIASIKAKNAELDLTGSVVASDAFFPFRDGIDVLAEVGATAVIHPGGSMRDSEVIAAADEHNLTMVITGVRHFRH